MNFNKQTIATRYFQSLLLFLGMLSFAEPVFAQQNYTPIERGEYTIREEKLEPENKVEISGSYRAFWGFRSEQFLPKRDKSGIMGQEIQLKLRSMVNSNASVNITLENQFTDITRGTGGYSSQNPGDQSDSSSDSGMAVMFEEAYLEYNHNPNAALKIGRHYVDIADRQGFIYQGTATGFSQECRIGTWCYYIGGVRLADGVDDSLYWVQLDYPVFESGQLIDDLWSPSKFRQQYSLNVELFRAFYRGKDIPLAAYGGWTGENSTNHSKDNGSAVYFDNSGVEYAGLKVGWNNDDFTLNFVYSFLSGKRNYHTGTQELGNVKALSNTSISGSLLFLEMDYHYLPEWKLEVKALRSSGTEQTNKDSNIWEQDSSAYLAVQRGLHGKALVYFNGKDNLGDGHSISNLSYENLGFSHRSTNQDFGVDFAYYRFRKTEGVYNQAGKKVNAIGSELDITMRWYMKENFTFDTFWGIFLAGEAYSSNDNVPPIENPQDLSLFGAALNYSF